MTPELACPEHNTLQSEAGYIDARPLTASSAKSTCDARPDHTLCHSHCSEYQARLARKVMMLV